jgi:hypothetical protein
MRKTFGLIVVLAALVGLTTSATAGIIYSQAEHHILTNGSWYLFKNWDTFTSQISAQHFGPCHDGVVKEISIGGGFEIFEGDLLPDALIVEIWEPIAPDRSPFILLGQWITPVGNIIYESDAEGFPLLTVDVSDAQLQLLHGYDYCIAAYSDGDDLHPLSWTIDMSHGNGAFWISNDNTITWAGTYWFGAPEDGNPTGNFEFELRGEIDCNPEIIYDQTFHHVVTGGSWWLWQVWDTFTSQIGAQAWAPCCPGVIETVKVGGAFELFEDQTRTPEDFIIEVWEPIAPARSPFILLAQWIIPTALLVDDVDVEGFPIVIADVSAFPLEVYPGVDYSFAAYSAEDQPASWAWTIDMAHACTFDFWISNDNTITWAGTYWFGNPEDGNPAAAFEFGLYGVTGTVEELVTPPVGVWGRYDSANADRPFFCAGWNWFSVPCPPDLGWEDPANWNGFTYALLENNLYRWENRTTELYDADFDTVEGYRGYVLRLDDDLGDVSFLGRCACCPTVEITLIGGWNWFGVPVTCNQDAVKVRNDQTGEVRTAAVDDAAGANRWLNWNWSFYDSAARTVRLVYFGGGSDDTMLREWFGYRTMVDTLDPGQTYTLIVPAE